MANGKIKQWLRRYREWKKHREFPPSVVISYSGQLTLQPKVCVSVRGYAGSQGVRFDVRRRLGAHCALRACRRTSAPIQTAESVTHLLY